MPVIQNKWLIKEKKKKEPPIVDSATKSCDSSPHINVCRATRSRSLRGVRK